jgi:carboxyl-terminal processing protease
MKQMVLDLRGNPGGLLPQAIEVSGRFIPRGKTIVSVKGRTHFMET